MEYSFEKLLSGIEAQQELKLLPEQEYEEKKINLLTKVLFNWKGIHDISIKEDGDVDDVLELMAIFSRPDEERTIFLSTVFLTLLMTLIIA